MATAASAVGVCSGSSGVRTDDRNGDGRPDVWRTFDSQGQLTAVEIDSNFDGRVDVREFYQHGALLRRESDRDFNGRIDLQEQFDPRTGEHVRSVVDVDYNGAADLLVLFRRGRPVFSQWTHAATRRIDVTRSTGFDAPRLRDDHALASLENPFRSDLALTAVDAGRDSSRCVGLSTSGGLPSTSSHDVPHFASARLSGSTLPRLFSILGGPHPPRGPPAGSFLTLL